MASTRWISGLVSLLLGFAALCALGGGQFISWLTFTAKKTEIAFQIVGQFSSISGALLGFLVAALAILGALVDKTIIANMQKTGHFKILLSELFTASVMYLAALFFALISMFISEQYLFYGVAITTSVFSFATFSLIVAGRKFYIVMINLK